MDLVTQPSEPDAQSHDHQAEHRLVARGLVTDQEGRWLLVRNLDEEVWVPPGGHVELTESPRLACAREIVEEAGVRVVAGRLLTLAWEPPNGRSSTRNTLIFDCGRYDSTDTPTESPDGEHVLRWVMPREALTIMRPDIATALALWIQDPAAPGALYIEDPTDLQRRALAAAITPRTPVAAAA